MKTKFLLIFLIVILVSSCSSITDNNEESYMEYKKLRKPEEYEMAFSRNRDSFEDIMNFMMQKKIDPLSIYYEDAEYKEDSKLNFNSNKMDIESLFENDDTSIFSKLSHKLNIASYFLDSNIVYFKTFLKHNEVIYVYCEFGEPKATQIYNLDENWYLIIEYYE